MISLFELVFQYIKIPEIQKILRSNVVRKPKKKPQGLFLPKYYVQVRHLPQAVSDLGHYC